MSKKAATAGKRASSARGDESARTVYRGVRLQPLVGKTRYSSDEIKRAIDVAIKKNPDAFAKGS